MCVTHRKQGSADLLQVTLCCDIKSATSTLPLTGSMQASLPQLDMTQSAGKAHAAGSCNHYRQPYSCQQEWTQSIRTAHTLLKKKVSIDKMECKACSCHAESTKATGAELQLYSSGNGSKVAAQLYLAQILQALYSGIKKALASTHTCRNF